jgi:phenylacetic acid degradation operon negative regulatory protein
MLDIPPRQLITTLYGLYARDEQNWLSVASLVRLMEDLSVDAAAVRSSVSRLKKRDVLRSVRREGRAGYELSPTTLEILREGDARIFTRPRATAADGWLVVVFSVPESEREKRHALRSQLSRLGFGSAAPGVWVAPGTLYDEVVRVLDRRGLTSYTEFFRGDYLGAGDVAARLGEWWDLDEMERRYADFQAEFAPVRARWNGDRPEPGAAFRAYVPMLTAWRRLPYLDPGLPLEHLPGGWAGIQAGELFTGLDRSLRDPAAEHARSILHAAG